MTAKTKVERLRETSSGFADLPDNIRIPPLGNCRTEVTKPIETASIDDIAFAQMALQAKSLSIYAQTDALRRVHDRARKSGALGADNALDAIAEMTGCK